MKKHLFSIFMAAVLLISQACGKKGPVLPPIKKNPQEVEMLEAFQRGGEIILKWKNPQSYVDGSPLSEISSVEIQMYKKMKKEEKEKTVDLKIFKKQSTVLRSIPASDLAEFRQDEGQDPPVYVYQANIKPSDYGSAVFFFGIKAMDQKGRESEISEPTAVEPKKVSLPPYGLKAQEAKDRVNLEWKRPEKNTDGSSPARIKGYNLYRSLKENSFERVNRELIEKNHFEDEGILFGKEYHYFVRSSANEEPPFLESENSETVKVMVEDTIPPQKPQDLIIVAGEDRITLTWNRVKDHDLKGYYVWRRIEGEEKFVLQNSDPLKDNIFDDFSIRKGVEYEYCVTALDESGNESEKSKIISGGLKGCRP